MTKIVLVGDTCEGKTCLIQSYKNKAYDDHFDPTVLDVYRARRWVNGKEMILEIHDTIGDENLFKSRALKYQNANVFMLCVPISIPGLPK